MFIDARVFFSRSGHLRRPWLNCNMSTYPAHSAHRGNNSMEGVDLSTPAAEEFAVEWS
jgi:hypothetical protein